MTTETPRDDAPAVGTGTPPSSWVPVEGDPAPPVRPALTPRPAASRRLRLRRARNPVLAALDGGGDVLQRRGRDVLVGVVVLIAPMVTLNLWATVIAYDRFDGPGPSLPGFADDASTGIEELSVLLALLLASLTAAVVGVFAANVLIADRFGAQVGLAEALSRTLRRLPAILVAWAVGHWWLPFLDAWAVGAGTDQLAARAIVALPLAMLPTALVLFVGPVMVAERAGPLRAFGRSWRLARMRYGWAVSFVAASAILGALLLVGVASLPAMLELTGLVTFGDYTWLANGIAAQIGVIVTIPLVALGTAQMYIEVRLDAEGMDIVLDADAAFGPRAAAP